MISSYIILCFCIKASQEFQRNYTTRIQTLEGNITGTPTFFYQFNYNCRFTQLFFSGNSQLSRCQLNIRKKFSYFTLLSLETLQLREKNLSSVSFPAEFQYFTNSEKPSDLIALFCFIFISFVVCFRLSFQPFKLTKKYVCVPTPQLSPLATITHFESQSSLSLFLNCITVSMVCFVHYFSHLAQVV